MSAGRQPCVVVGVDGSPGGNAALAWALRAAADRGAALRLVAVHPADTSCGDPDLRDPRVRLVGNRMADRVAAVLREARAAAGAPPDVAVYVDLVAGQPAATLVHASRTADALVVGSRGRGAVRSTVQGSVALHCAAHARCPVVVVHGEPPAPGAPVVCGLDDTPVARAALRRAAAEAFRLRAPLHVVTVLDVPDSWGDLFAAPAPRLRAERRCSEAVEEALAEAGPTRPDDVRVEVVEGIASEVLVARAAGAALLAVGSRSRSRLEGMLLGSVALRCAVDAPCPVMVVHPPPEAAPG